MAKPNYDFEKRQKELAKKKKKEEKLLRKAAGKPDDAETEDETVEDEPAGENTEVQPEDDASGPV